MPSATSIQDPAEVARGHLARIPENGHAVFATNGPSPTDAAAFALKYQGAIAVKQQQKSWTGVSANLAQVLCSGPLHVDLLADKARLSVVLEEVGGSLEVRATNMRTDHEADRLPQPLSMIRAGLDAYGCAVSMRYVRHLTLQFDLVRLARLRDDELDLSNAFAPRLMFHDRTIMQLAQLFAEECADDGSHCWLYGDNLSVALLLVLSRLGKSRPSAVAKGRLAPWQVRRVTDYLMAHLAEDVELRQISDLVQLSRSYFSRAFKTSTGLAPHQWLLKARIAKAQELLLTSDRPLAQIAIHLGFADQAHFTRTFARMVGESPGAWQRARRA
jgi:AraC family transcriptional regulator